MATDTPVDWEHIAVQLVRRSPAVYFDGLSTQERDALESALKDTAEIDRDVLADRTADAADIWSGYRDEVTS